MKMKHVVSGLVEHALSFRVPQRYREGYLWALESMVKGQLDPLDTHSPTNPFESGVLQAQWELMSIADKTAKRMAATGKQPFDMPEYIGEIVERVSR